MVRPKRIRKIYFKPDATYFKPAGIPMASLDEVILSFDELEAIRLTDFEGFEQHEAAKKMGISQSTLSRLLKEGRKKIAQAIINSNAIKIEGGNFKMVQPRAGRFRGRMGGFGAGPQGVCVCPKCGYEEPKVRGFPCREKKCPKCNSMMTRKI